MNKNIIFLMFLLVIFPISALQTTPISYIEKVTYNPICGTTCSNITTFNSTTNTTLITNNCVTGCHAIFNIGLMFAGDDEFRNVEINTSSQLYQNGSDFIIPGVYMATLGNNSDVTGINEKIQNLSITINEDLVTCFNNISNIQNNATLSSNECSSTINIKDTELNTKNVLITDLEKKSKQRLLIAIGSFILGVITIKWGEPYFKGKIPKKDPIESGTSPYEGHY